MSDYTERLADAVRHMHGCDASHVETVPVHETFQGQIVWDGTVEVFDLQGHPTASRCYAWSHKQDDGSDRYFAVLHSPPVESPLAAVRAMIVTEHRGKSTH